MYYIVLSHITHDHAGYDPGGVVDLPDDAAEPLIDLGHVVPADPPQRDADDVDHVSTEPSSDPEPADSEAQPTGRGRKSRT